MLVQDGRFDALDSVTVCPLTTDSTPLPLFRVPIQPGDANGLREQSFAMADQVTTILKSRLGRLEAADVAALDRALLVFLGLAGGSR